MAAPQLHTQSEEDDEFMSDILQSSTASVHARHNEHFPSAALTPRALRHIPRALMGACKSAMVKVVLSTIEILQPPQTPLTGTSLVTAANAVASFSKLLSCSLVARSAANATDSAFLENAQETSLARACSWCGA